MGNEPSKQRRQSERQTHAGPRPIAGRSDALTQMIPDQFTSLPQVTQELRRSGLESCNLIIGIDCTKSNEWSGKRTFGGRCLHEIDDPSVRNPYEDVIETIGRTLQDF
ncbi:Copine-like protein, partial [Phytophthora palmivora]